MVGDIPRKRSIDLNFFIIATTSIQKLKIYYIQYLNISLHQSLTHFAVTTTYLSTVSKNQEVRWNSLIITMGFWALRHRLHSELTIGLETFLLPLFHSESLYSSLVGADVIMPRHIADMSRKWPIRLLTLNCFSFVMALIVMFVIAIFSGWLEVGYMRRGGTPPSIAGAFTICLFYFEE